MNKFLSDIVNFNAPINDVVSNMLNTRCEGITLLEAMKLGNAMGKLGRASSELHQLAYAIADGVVISVKPRQ